ncbi:family 43 glycosylhydrolase [Hymenobacter monticola]|uniref:Family 43 glycosylhydrolase n=1 Tax=Hymenobacter monticola TaxID=1705399 RepID=A0ABY4BBX3_9BACT|nr:family 43 glycosylhydrolase [Hymenobacter monticola]UOE36399.1 family 43 glycosylhydrolase [Hymenobacter monticola]
MKNTLYAGTLCLLLGLGGPAAHGQVAPKPTTICNPLNLSYRYQLKKPSRREAADPTMVAYKGKYYLFVSKSGCYWSSSDLLNWKMITSQQLPFEDYAPTVVVMRDSLFFMATNWGRNNKSIFKTADPESGKWQVAVQTFPKNLSDPDLFLDDNGKLYLYDGTSNETPIAGTELNSKTLLPVGQSVVTVSGHQNVDGWERQGDYNEKEEGPFVEGAWMTKHAGKYYFQYAAPGTQHKSYNDGVYMAETPLGPFKLAEHNPYSYKPEGFITGAGHGSLFQDKYGNYWKVATMVISVKQMFERRLGLFPTFFDADGTLHTYTAFGDFPHTVPQRKLSGPADYQPTAMLLSYHKPVEVSSTLDKHPKENVTGEDIRRWWSAATGNKGEFALVDLQSPCTVRAVQLNFADEGTTILGSEIGRADSIYYQYLLEYSTDKKTWKTLADKRTNKTDVPHDYLELATPVTARYVRLTNYHVPDGKFALSGLRVFGKGTGKAPAPVAAFTATRDAADARNVTLTWPAVPGATGYNIRFGSKADKQYLDYQVLGANTLTMHSLNKLQDYYFTIDAFNENGITKGTKTVKAATPAK